MKRIMDYYRLLNNKIPVKDSKRKRHLFWSRMMIGWIPNLFFLAGIIYEEELIYFDTHTFSGFIRLIAVSWGLFLLLFLLSYLIYVWRFSPEKEEGEMKKAR